MPLQDLVVADDALLAPGRKELVDRFSLPDGRARGSASILV